MKILKTIVILSLLFIALSTSYAQDSLNIALVSDFYDNLDNTVEVIVKDDLLFAATKRTGIIILDISDPLSPREISHYSTVNNARQIVVKDTLALINLGNTGVEIVNINDIENPRFITLYIAGGYIKNIDVAGELLFLSLGQAGLRILDISDLAEITLAGTYERGEICDVHLDTANYIAYVAADGFFSSVNYRNPQILPEVIYYNTGVLPNNIYVEDNYLYLTDSMNGLYIYSVEVNNLQLLSTSRLGINHEAFRISTYQDYLFLATSNDNTSHSGIYIADISDPTRPELTCFEENLAEVYNVCFKENIAYFSCGITGIQIFDVTNPFQPVNSGEFDKGLFSDIEISGNYAYLANGDRGVKILNISDPFSPEEAGEIFNPGEQVIDISVCNNQLAVCKESGLYLYDITNPYNTQLLGYLEDNIYNKSVFLSEEYAFTTSDQEQGFKILDVSNPENPVEISLYNSRTYIKNIFYRNHIVYYNDNINRFYSINLVDPANPEEIDYCQFLASPSSLAVHNQYLYVTLSIQGSGSVIQIYSLADMRFVNNLTFDSIGEDMYVEGGYLYISTIDNGLQVYDIYDPTNPFSTGYSSTIEDPGKMAISNDYIYLINSYKLYIYDCNDATGVEDDSHQANLPRQFVVGDIYPNPFNPSFCLDLEIPQSGDVSFSVYNLLGKMIYQSSRHYYAGKQQFYLNTENLDLQSSSAYFLKVAYGNEVVNRKLLLLK